MLASLFLVVNVGLVLGQWDPSARSFAPGTAVEVDLAPGDERVVYLGAQESEPYNFDFYASDFTCEIRTPSGEVTTLEPARGERLLDLWHEHSTVAVLVAGEEGPHVVSCSGRHDAELLLASPARFTVGWVSPTLGLLLLVTVSVVGGATLLIRAAVVRACRNG